MATTHPDRLYFTGNDEADALIAEEPLALLIGFVLDQQVPVQKAFSGPLELKRRIGNLDASAIAGMDPGELDRAFRERYVAEVRERLGQVVFEAELVEGQAMTPEQAVEYALST